MVGSLEHAITAAAVYGVLVISIAGALLVIWKKRIPLKRPEISWIELAAIALVPAQAIMLFLQFTKYPIFLIIFSTDFEYHLQTSLHLQTGDFALASLSYPPAVKCVKD